MQEPDYQQYLVWGIISFFMICRIMHFFLSKDKSTQRKIYKTQPPNLIGETEMNDDSVLPSRVMITKVKKINARQPEENENLERILEKEKSYIFDTTIMWKDTIVKEIIFNHKSMMDLNQYLIVESLNLIIENNSQIPEVGGVLLGRPFFSKKYKTYRVLVEEFVAIEPEYHDPYQLEFSSQSIAKKMGDIQDLFPKLILVGWFHTHPGHGLFLSTPDLRINETFFKEAYQFAMEIDPVSKRIDTGFFTRKKNGKVNNINDKNLASRWHSWSYLQSTFSTIKRKK